MRIKNEMRLDFPAAGKNESFARLVISEMCIRDSSSLRRCLGRRSPQAPSPSTRTTIEPPRLPGRAPLSPRG